MKKKLIKLTENDLHSIIRKTAQRMISEINDIYNTRPGYYTPKSLAIYALMNLEFGNGFSINGMIENCGDDAMARIRYASDRLPLVGEGKRRTVFILNDKYVLKLTNGSHRYQTKNEYDAAMYLGIDLFPRIIHQSRDFSWSIIERARPLKESDCQKILGMPLYSKGSQEPSFQGFQLWAETMGRQPSRQDSQKLNLMPSKEVENIYKNLVQTNQWFKDFYRLENSQRSDLTFGTDISLCGYDFRAANLGVVNRNGKDMIVLVDAGFTKPWDTRKLQSRYGVKSPQIPDNIY